MQGVTHRTFPPPVMEARRWLESAQFAEDMPLINVSQAAPVEPPPQALCAAMAKAIEEKPSLHLYGPVLGLPELRKQLGCSWSELYYADVSAEHVAITAGCNQAFAAALSSIAEPGDAVILPVPWYFNHKMWLDMAGVSAIPLSTGHDMLPDPQNCAALITEKTRAICLVTPNNPAGVEYPAELLEAFFDLCQARSIKLILDETYRDFHASDTPVHFLFQRPNWDKTLIQLYSFSKAFRLTGHRVGALVTDPHLLKNTEKFLDTVTICAPQLGQFAALWGLENLGTWLAGERREILARAQAVTREAKKMAPLGWHLKGLGAYFAYLEHPFAISSADLAPKLVSQAGILLLPGTMFRPKGDPIATKEIRIAFANLDASGIATLFSRLHDVSFPLASADASP